MFKWLFRPKESLEDIKHKRDVEFMRKLYKESLDRIWSNWEEWYGWKRPEDKKEERK